MNSLIIPKNYVQKLSRPFIFLAGPIRSAPDWQDKAIRFLFSQESNLMIASPRDEIKEDLERYVINGEGDDFGRRRAWERHYLEHASKKGAILFWLPGEEKHNCQKVYGATTRLEIGEWMTNYKHDNSVRFCMGSDGNFPELKPIRYDLSLDAPDKKIFDSLEETCREALQIAVQKQ